MPFTTSTDLPLNIRKILPEHAQHIYKEAFNSAYEEYKKSSDRRGGETREEVAHKVAWGAVKKVYKKGPDQKWHQK